MEFFYSYYHFLPVLGSAAALFIFFFAMAVACKLLEKICYGSLSVSEKADIDELVE